jgi:uncharacterized protein (DUF1697 family)
LSFVALLRAVNLGGVNTISSAALRALAEELGLENARTLLQSGNLLFDSKKSAAQLEKLLAARTGWVVFVRTDAEWRRIVSGNPFRKEAKDDPSHLLVVVMDGTISRTRVKALEAAIVGPERIAAKGKHLYCVYPAGIGRSKLTSALMEKHLGVRGTGRNWNTVLKIDAALRT